MEHTLQRVNAENTHNMIDDGLKLASSETKVKTTTAAAAKKWVKEKRRRIYVKN
jgi:hypothetical protein